MKPKTKPEDNQLQLFQAQFEQLLNLDHPLCQLADRIDWNRFEAAFADCYCPDFGAPAKSVRLMVGLHYLKHTFNESDESLLERWLENPYWQYFCGFETMQHQPPLHPTSLTKWRNRVGAENLLLLLTETIATAQRCKLVNKQELAQVNVDTTVQEKNITHPTDSKLYLKAINKLADAAAHRGVKLRQTYRRVGKAAAIMVSRYAHAKQFKRMGRKLKKMRTWLGRVIRDLRRKMPHPDASLSVLLDLCERLHGQQRQDKKKLYSLHEPSVMCISKGKAHKRYEFGQKVSISTTNRGNWIVGVDLCQGNPYDGHTLSQAITTTEKITGVAVSNAFVDKGYRGHDYQGEAKIHIAGSSTRKLTRTLKKRRKRRSAVEPKIGHLKSDNRMRRCFLHGPAGDQINAILAAAASNMQKLLRIFAHALSQMLHSLLLCSIPHHQMARSIARPPVLPA